MNSIKLKSCPFCGGGAKKKVDQLSEVYAYANQVTYSCTSCGCSKSAIGDTSKGGYADNSTTETRALEAWNKRHDQMSDREQDLEQALGDVLVEYQGLGGCRILIDQCKKALG